jgi:hypothetical protein
MKERENEGLEEIAHGPVGPVEWFPRTGFGGGEVAEVVQGEVGPVPGDDEVLFVRRKRPVVVDEADTAVELGVAGEALLDPGHADEDHPDAGAVVVVPDL